MAQPEPSVPIQLCIQGGAAKIALLTAFMEAVEELHNAGELRVTKIAGTSAGAIVGTLFAAAVPMATVRNRLGTAPLKKIVPKKGRVRTSIALARGRPVWSEKELRKLLNTLLSESKLVKENPPKELLTFDHILKYRGIQTEVMATNLADGMKAVRRAGDPIVGSLLDSAAVPFFFRAKSSSNSTVVDGGLCENLPIDLLTDNKDDGPIVAVSFLHKGGAPPGNLREYCLAVVGAGIEHSADRAKLLLEERAKRSSLPHEVFPIDSPIESFEFEKAILDGLGRIYEDILDKARTWLAGFVARRKQQIQRERAQVAQGQLQQAAISREAAYYSHQIPVNLAKMYRDQHVPIKLRYSYARLEVTVSPDPDHPDILDHLAEFHTLDHQVWCHRLPVLVALQGLSAIRSPWQIFGPNDEEIPYYYMIMDDDSDPKTLEWLVCFETPLPPQSGPYRLVLVDRVRNFMPKLRNGERDDLWVSFHRREGSVDKVEVIAYVPEGLPQVTVDAMAGASKYAKMNGYELKRKLPTGHNPYGLRGTGIGDDRWGMYLDPIK